VKTVEPSAETAFEALFTQHWSRVYGLLFRLTGEHAEAEDLALEVFWRYYDRPPADQDQNKLGGWLYRVALRLGYNALRTQRRRHRYEESAGWQELHADVSIDPEGLVELAEQRQRVRRVLGEMNPRAAQVLILRYSGFSYVEIATTLDLAPGSVGTLLARAEADFQKRYELTWRGE
jgi:RNA polymerase sigma-70 factor (ECF subfamily)